MKNYPTRNLLRKLLPRKAKRLVVIFLTHFIREGKIISVQDGRKFISIKERVFWRVYYERQYEPEISGFLSYFVKKEDCVADIGANFGWYTTLLGRLAVDGVVYAFEPVPYTFDILEKNIHLNDLGNIQRFRICLGDENKTVRMNFAKHNAGLAHIAAGGEISKGFETRMGRLDDYMERYVGRISLVKIDVEGVENMVLKGAHHVLSAENPPVVLLEMNEEAMKRSKTTREEIVSRMRQYGFNFYCLDDKRQLRSANIPKVHDVICVGRGQFADRLKSKILRES